MHFHYTAISKEGKTINGTSESPSREFLVASLAKQGLHPIIVKADHTKSSFLDRLQQSQKVKPRDLVVFTRQLSTMISAGVPLTRSLATLQNQLDNKYMQQVIAGVTKDIEGGKPLSDAFAKYPNIFSPVYVNMVRAGETGGILDKILERLAFQQEKDAALKGKIKAAMVYPSVIGVVTILAFFVLMTFIVPKIGNILLQLGTQLPIYTRILLSVSHTMRKAWFIAGVFVGLPVLIIVFRHWEKTPKGRYAWHSFLLKIPVVNVLLIKTAIARFSRIFASLMGAGVSINQAIETTAGAIGNAVIEKELLASSKAVAAGSELSKEIEKSKHFPPIVAQMLAVGEETGQTDTIILKIAEFYEEEVDAAVSALSSIIEPIMIVVLGGMVGLIAISVFGPITRVESTPGSGS